MSLLDLCKVASFLVEAPQKNIIVAQEAINYMHKYKGKKGCLAFKVDLEKAYDSVSWEFWIPHLEILVSQVIFVILLWSV